MEVSGQFQALITLPWGKSFTIPIELEGWVVHRVGLGRLPASGIKLQTAFCILPMKSSSAMAEVFSRWPLTTEVLVQSQANSCRISSGQSETGTDLFRVISYITVTIIPFMLHIHAFICHRYLVILTIGSIVN